MSPEGVVHAIEQYLEALRTQAGVAEAFFDGRIAEGIEGLLKLPEDIRLKIDQLIWEAAGGEAIDPTDEASSELIAAAILHSLEERMGVA
jgi:chorismate mutase